jgi:hypothetical protein
MTASPKRITAPDAAPLLMGGKCQTEANYVPRMMLCLCARAKSRAPTGPQLATWQFEAASSG